MLTAARTADVVVVDVMSSSLPGTSRLQRLRCSMPFSCHIILDQLVCAETLFTALTVHQRIREAAQMSGSYPCLRIHQDRAVNTYVVRDSPERISSTMLSLRCSSALRQDYRNPMYLQVRRKFRNRDIQTLSLLPAIQFCPLSFPSFFSFDCTDFNQNRI